MSSSRFTPSAKGIAENAVWDVSKLAIEILASLALSGGLGTLFSTALVSYFEPLRGYTVSLSLLAFGLLSLATIPLIRRLRRDVPRFPAVPCQFHIVRREIKLSLDDSRKGSYRRTLTVRALEDHLDRYSDKFSWTGSNPVHPTTQVPGHSILMTAQKNIWQLFEVHFGRTLRKGETVEIDVVWPIGDASTMRPFLSTVVEEPTDHLRFVVDLPASYYGKVAQGEETYALGARKTIDTSRIPFGANGIAAWEPPDPSLLHVYELNWTW